MELPVEFREYAIEALGEEVAQRLFVEIENSSEVTSIRINPLKAVSEGGAWLRV